MLGIVELPLAVLLWVVIGGVGLIVALLIVGLVTLTVERLRQEREQKAWDRIMKGVRK